MTHVYGDDRKIEIHLWQLGDAGGYDLVVYDNGISKTLRLILSSGQPWSRAKREATLLATALDCELVV